MPLDLTWQEVAIRLVLTVLAGAIVGFNRGEHGRAAGLRTSILVCLAASISMIQANLLLATRGRSPDSFIMLDLMRLPLGILSGMGFIGGGAILKHGKMIHDRHGVLSAVVAADSLARDELQSLLLARGFLITSCAMNS